MCRRPFCRRSIADAAPPVEFRCFAKVVSGLYFPPKLSIHSSERERSTVNKSASKPKKVVLAYSGGLDTAIIIPWLQENYGCEVIAMIGDVGQQEDRKSTRLNSSHSSTSYA